MTTTTEPSFAAPPTADIALLTIIPEAFEAVRQVFGLTRFDARGGYEWAWGFVQAKGHQLTVATGLALDRENIAAATFTDALLDAWKPRHLLLVDIGGAVKGRDDVQLGDVVTHTHLHYYDFKKETDGGDDSPRNLPHAAPSSRLRELSRRPSLRGDQSWIAKINVRRPRKGEPKVLPGEMLVGGTLFANSAGLHHLLKKHPKVIAVEMEGAGVARGVLDWSVRGNMPEFLIVRGMSDFCNVPPSENQRTRDRWKCYAASSAAAHAHALISEMTLSPPPTNGETSRRFPRQDEPLDNLWQAPSNDLTGRDDELDKVAAYFFEGRARPKETQGRRHVICGEAGMGKSVLARQIAGQAKQQYLVRWWVDANDEIKIRAGLRELARQLGIPSASMELGIERDQESAAHRYLSDLRKHLDADGVGGRVLVVLDNVDDPDLKHKLQTVVLRYLPPRICDVLITSQSRRWHPIAKATMLFGLDPAIGAKLIATESGRPELSSDPNVYAISTLFGGRPLFLKQAAALLHDGDEPAFLRAQLTKTPEHALDVLPEIEGFDPLWRATYSIAVERADRARPGAREVLEAMSLWGAEPITHRLIAALQQNRNASVEGALNTLTDRSLIDRQGSAVDRSNTVHRIVAALVRTLSKERGALPNALSLAAAATLSAIPSRDQLRRPEGQQLMVYLAPHVWALMDHTQRFNFLGIPTKTISVVAECASMLGLYLRTMSEWVSSEQANEFSVQISDPVTDPGGAALRTIRLANVLRQRGQFQRAEELVTDALPKLASFGDPCDYAWGVAVEARILRHRPASAPHEALARLNAALPILESSERLSEPAILRQLSELHGYLSVLHRQLSNLSEAEKESEKGLSLIVDGLGSDDVLQAAAIPDDPLLATHLRALGGVWRLRGDFQRAMLAHEHALKIFEHVYGRDHTDVYRALDSLGRVQREWGELAAALETFERAEKISDAQFGIGHAHAGTAAVNRALTFLELGQPERAYEDAVRGLGIYRSAYKEPEENSSLQNEATVWALFVQADALAELGDLRVAVRDHECVLAWRLAHQRSGHAHQASSYFALAEAIWRRDGKAALDQVLHYHRHSLNIREDVFGSAPNFWVAQSQARLGQLTRDVVLLQRAYECFNNQLKPEHWRTRAVVAAMEELTQP